MQDLKVTSWQLFGHDRLYVNLPDGTAIGWADRGSGTITVLHPRYRDAVTDALARQVPDLPALVGEVEAVVPPGPPAPPPVPPIPPMRGIRRRGAARRNPPEPVSPEKALPEPAFPEAVRPEPAPTETVRPEPASSEAVRPEPVRPEPVRPEPVRPEPVRPEPVRPEPVRPEPVAAGKRLPEPAAEGTLPGAAGKPPADGPAPWSAAASGTVPESTAAPEPVAGPQAGPGPAPATAPTGARRRRPATLPALTPATDLASRRPGTGLREQLGETGTGALVRVATGALRRHKDADPRRGTLAGERRVGAELKRLTRHGWRVLHSVPLPDGTEIGHLLIGPGGVFAVSTEHRPGASVRIEDGTLRVDEETPQPYACDGLPGARRAREALEAYCAYPVPVQTVVVFTAVTALEVVAAPAGVRVYRERQVSALAPLTGVLTATQVERVYDVARNAEAWLDA